MNINIKITNIANIDTLIILETVFHIVNLLLSSCYYGCSFNIEALSVCIHAKIQFSFCMYWFLYFFVGVVMNVSGVQT